MEIKFKRDKGGEMREFFNDTMVQVALMVLGIVVLCGGMSLLLWG